MATLSDQKRMEEEKERQKQEQKRKEEERIREMGMKLAAAQQVIAERMKQNQRKVLEEERDARRKFIDVDEEENTTEDYRKAKRAKIEVTERSIKEANLADAIKRRQHWEDKKTKECGDWKL
eukprot:Sspe_Gene.64700::Locus_38327_Transcript_1_1_Confidence_1.000_Length_435::g.64700::m.64700